jgi:hypothetical protein
MRSPPVGVSSIVASVRSTAASGFRSTRCCGVSTSSFMRSMSVVPPAMKRAFGAVPARIASATLPGTV